MDDDKGLNFDTDKIKTLQKEYYASAFSGDLQSDDFVNAFRTWLNDQTDGRLKDMIDGVKPDPDTIMLIASTVDFAARWDRGFGAEQGYFKCDGVRRSCTYLSSVDRWNDKVYFGDGYAMYCQELENNAGKMWFILPDENKTVDEIFEKIDFCNITNRTERRNFGKVTVKVPKFDISLQSDLKSALRSVGITACFEDRGDFEPIIENSAAFIGKAAHGCGVKIDEKGIVGSAFTYFAILGAAEPLDDKYEFIADRPFIFSVESDDGLPLFTGVVNRP
jgi:serpin B